MFSFTAKPRLVQLRGGASISLPREVTLTATLGPKWLFGAGGDFPRFVVAGSTGVSTILNRNTGWWYMKGGTQPNPVLATHRTADGALLEVSGNQARLTFTPSYIEELSGAANALLYGIPMVLASQMPFPAVVESITGRSDMGEFGYEIAVLRFRVPLVRQAEFNNQVSTGLRYLEILGQQDYSRIHAGLAYFHRAARLIEAGHTPWEFMAEAVLNLAKCLEALFPAQGDTKSRDAVRAGLQKQGFSDSEVETWFVPALALRSNLDVAHVKLAILTRAHVELLHLYVENAAEHFRTLLQRVVTDALDGRATVAMYTPTAVEGEVLKSLSLLATKLAAAVPGMAPAP